MIRLNFEITSSTHTFPVKKKRMDENKLLADKKEYLGKKSGKFRMR